MKQTFNYSGLAIAGPMVRVSSLPFRELCASFGADVVFTEEIIAAKLSKCRREVLSTAGLFDGEDATVAASLPTPHPQRIEFASYGQHAKSARRTAILSTLPKTSPNHFPEGAPLILQLGCAEPHNASKAVLLTMNDVDGFDVNMGCPKSFSVQNKMGSSLMKEPPRARSILVAMRMAMGAQKPFSYKMRVFEDIELSLNHLKLCTAPVTATEYDEVLTKAPALQKFLSKLPPDAREKRKQEILQLPTLVHSVTFHARLIPQRSETAPRYDLALKIIKRARVELPSTLAFIFNGSLGMAKLSESDEGQLSSEDSALCVLDPSLGCISKKALVERAKRFGFDGALLARGAMWNPAVFGSVASDDLADGKKPFTADVIATHRMLYAVSITEGVLFSFIKYHLTRTVHEFVGLEPLPAVLQRQEERFAEEEKRKAQEEEMETKQSASGNDRKKGAGTLMAHLSDATRDGKTVNEVALAFGYSEAQSETLQRRFDRNELFICGVEGLAIATLGLDELLKADFVDEALNVHTGTQEAVVLDFATVSPHIDHLKKSVRASVDGGEQEGDEPKLKKAKKESR